jgi:S-layer protein (TIGR01567 family)
MKSKNIFSVLVAFLMLSSIASAVEIRGSIVEQTGGGAFSMIWTPQNFAALQYDIDTGVSGENMTVAGSGRTIPIDGLVYSTRKTVITKLNHPTYSVVGWLGEKYVAVGGKSNKVAKLVLDMDDDAKIALISGQTTVLGGGYTLKINAVDARTNPRQAWLSLYKDNTVVDESVVQEKQTYNYNTTVLGDSGTPVFSIYVSSIFSGTEADLLQLKYGWLMDASSAKEIKAGDKYGSMEVTTSGTDEVVLRNKNTISLSRNSEVTIMGNMKFKVANNNDENVLRFYPKVDVVGDVVSITNTTPVVSGTPVVRAPVIVNTTNTTLENCTPVEKIVEREKVIYVNVTVTPEPTAVPVVTVAPKSPGFSGLFAIVGLIAIAFIVKRQRKINL